MFDTSDIHLLIITQSQHIQCAHFGTPEGPSPHWTAAECCIDNLLRALRTFRDSIKHCPAEIEASCLV